MYTLLKINQRLRKPCLNKFSFNVLRFASGEMGKYPKHWIRNLIRDLRAGKEPFPLIHPKTIYVAVPIVVYIISFVLPNLIIKDVFPSEKRFRVMNVKQ